MLGSGLSDFVVLLASVLKPVDDPRIRGKFAKTLLERPGVRVHIAGRAAGNQQLAVQPTTPKITSHVLLAGSRRSLDRLAAQGRYWQLLRRLRPALVVVHAPELLPLTLLWQRLGRGRKFLYDIRENYALNVSTQGVYRGLVRRGLAAGLRWVEAHAARRATGLLLAEKSYAEELPFLRALAPERVIVLENKYQPAPGEVLPATPRPLPSPAQPLQLLYSGTISLLNGLEAALRLTEALHRLRPGGAALTIIGFCQQPELLGQLEQWQQRGVTFQLIGGAEPVPHAAIVAAIGRSHLGLALYQPHPSTERCRPTKLFEYLAHGLPVLVPENPLWQELILGHDAGLVLDLASPDYPVLANVLLAELASRAGRPGPAFYQNGFPATALWADEGKKLWHLLDSLV